MFGPSKFGPQGPQFPHDLVELVGGPHDGEKLPANPKTGLLFAGVPPEDQSPEHVVRAAYLRGQDGRFHFYGWKSRHEIKIELQAQLGAEHELDDSDEADWWKNQE